MHQGSHLPFQIIISRSIFSGKGPSAELINNHGVTILVTCDYSPGDQVQELKGTNIDAEAMAETFKKRNFVIYRFQNKGCVNGDEKIHPATKQNIKDCVREVQAELKAYHKEAENKVVIFAFSGHGTSKKFREYIYDNEGKALSVQDDLVRPLVTHRNKKADKIPILFLLDACRGPEKIKGAAAKGKKGPSDDQVEHYFGGIVDEVYGNYRIDFSTIPGHVSYCVPGEGSVWMPRLAKAMREQNGSFPDIADEVKKEVHSFVEVKVKEEGKVKIIEIKQQCDSVCSITSGALYLSDIHDKIPGNCFF